MELELGCSGSIDSPVRSVNTVSRKEKETLVRDFVVSKCAAVLESDQLQVLA